MGTSQHLNTVRTQGRVEPAEGAGRKAYDRPQLTAFGNIRGITLGGSPGASDSGQNNMRPEVFFTSGYDGIP